MAINPAAATGFRPELLSPKYLSNFTKITSISLPLRSTNLLLSVRHSSRSVKCNAVDFDNGHYNNYGNRENVSASASYPRPTEVPWKKEICNLVSLIGVVGKPVEIKHLTSGKVVGWTSLAVKKSVTDTFWVNLTFWEDLAHVAFQHVEKGQQIYVSGRLVADTVENDDGRQQTYYKVIVQQLNFIERSTGSVPLYGQESSYSSNSDRKPDNNYANTSTSAEALWQAFFANPVDWWDNRKSKRTPKYPDFKHKDTGEALWIEGRNNPPWVKSQLAILDFQMEESLADENPRNSSSGYEFPPF